jgi:hypothetical protein
MIQNIGESISDHFLAILWNTTRRDVRDILAGFLQRGFLLNDKNLSQTLQKGFS